MVSVRFDVPVFIGWLFLLTIKLLELKVPLASINVTSDPTAGDAGKVTVIGLAVVFANIWSPSTAVYAVIVEEFKVT